MVSNSSRKKDKGRSIAMDQDNTRKSIGHNAGDEEDDDTIIEKNQKDEDEQGG
jgi:hypothetical protein